MNAMRIVIFGVSLILTLAIALPCGAFLFDPLHRTPERSWIPVTDVSILNFDGTPAQYPVIVPCRDAWMRKPDLTVGYAFLRRVSESEKVVALHDVTEPMGLPLMYDEEQQEFRDCCWNLRFDLNGNAKQSHRSEHLRALETRIDKGMVMVRWESFWER
jgi:hypothetical protein